MRTFLALAFLLHVAQLGCYVGPHRFDRGSLAQVSTVSVPVRYQVLAEQAEGRSCESLENPRYSLALARALQAVPGAQALVDARYMADGQCVVVRGKAVRVD